MEAIKIPISARGDDQQTQNMYRQAGIVHTPSLTKLGNSQGKNIIERERNFKKKIPNLCHKCLVPKDIIQ